MFIRPALVDPSAGNDSARYTIRDPFTRVHLAAEGEEKPDIEYWLRRVMEGGAELCAPPKPTEQAEDAEPWVHPGREPVEPVGTAPVPPAKEALQQGEPLNLSAEERAKLPPLLTQDGERPLEYAVGVSDEHQADEETHP